MSKCPIQNIGAIAFYWSSVSEREAQRNIRQEARIYARAKMIDKEERRCTVAGWKAKLKAKDISFRKKDGNIEELRDQLKKTKSHECKAYSSALSNDRPEL